MSHDSRPPLRRISLLASSFSGSTLLGILLCQDSRFFGLGDTYLIPGISDEGHICNCGLTVVECEFRVQLAKQLTARNLPVGMILNKRYQIPGKLIASHFGGTRISSLYQKLGQALGYERVYADFLVREKGFLESISELGDFNYYLDGCKNLVRADIFTAFNPDNQIIHLVRNPYAVLHSGATRHEDRGRSISTHLRGWMTYNRKARKLCQAHPERSVLVLFDDFVNDPTAMLEHVSSKLGWGELDVKPDNLNPGITHIIGNRSRHNASKVRAKQLQPGVEELEALGVPRKELDLVSATYESLCVQGKR